MARFFETYRLEVEMKLQTIACAAFWFRSCEVFLTPFADAWYGCSDRSVSRF